MQLLKVEYFSTTRFGIIKNVDLLKKNPEIKISMNFGVSDIMNNNLFNFLLNTVDEEVGRKFYIELLEDEEIADYKILKNRIDKLKKKGIKFKVDDFGALKAMVNFCNEVGIKTTAEFIDSEEVLNKVKEAGVDHGQGYFLGKPKPPEELGWQT